MFSWEMRLFQETLATGICSPFSSVNSAESVVVKAPAPENMSGSIRHPFFIIPLALDLFPCFQISRDSYRQLAQCPLDPEALSPLTLPPLFLCSSRSAGEEILDS